MSILEVKHITQQFGELRAVDDVTFDVEEGEIFGIAGPNGAGKSTLFNMITGFYHYTGEILFQKENIIKLRPHQICHKGIARTFQIPQLFLTLPVYENLKVGAHFGARADNGHDEEQDIKDVVELLELNGKEHIISSHLSLYDKKLTMLGVAMATKPKLLLIDEPIGGLSPMETKQFMELVQKINKELGLTIIIIEHLMTVLTALSNRMMIIENGRRIALDTPEKVCCDERVIEVYLGRGKHA